MKNKLYSRLLTTLLLTVASLAEAASISGSNIGNVNIPDGSPGAWVSSQITISGAPAGATVTGVDVSFRCAHPYSGDLVVDLNADANGNSGNRNLWNREGAAADNPTRTVSGISTFNGLSVNRAWYLYARDYAVGDSGYIDEWTITVYYSAVTPTTYAITPNPATVDEGVGTLTFTITRSGGTPAETIYASTTTGEGNANNNDYNGIVNQAVSFSSGQLTRTVAVTINNDTTTENTETFGFIVQRNSSDPVSTYLAKRTFTITDDDLPTTYAITSSLATVYEGVGTLTFTVTRSGGTPTETIYASTTTTEGYANNSDYTGIVNQAVNFTSGQLTRTVAVTINNDTMVENDETFGFIVQRNSNDPVSTYLAKRTFTVVNDDAPPTYAITPNPATVDEGAGTLTFTITRSGGTPAETIYASTTTTEGYANTSDYVGIVNQAVNFTSGQLTRTVAVTINNDTMVENDETFGFIVQRNSSDPVSTYLAKRTFTITDNDLGSGLPVSITQDFIPIGRANRPAYPLTANYITIHDTDNTDTGANAAMHAIYVKSDAAAAIPASWHFTVDNHEIYQHLPLNENGWHAGDGLNGTGNRQSIGVEICMNDDGNRAQAEENAAWLTAKLLTDLNLPLTQVKQHNNWSGKNCPSVLRGRAGGWDGFLVRVAFYMNQTPPPASSPVITNPKRIGTTFTASTTTEVGRRYILERRPSFNTGSWSPVSTNNGTGGVITLTDSGAVAPTQIYRVRVE